MSSAERRSAWFAASVFDAIGGFDESLPSAQDVDLWLRICERFAAGFVPEVLVRIWQPNDGGRISEQCRRD